jgi:hypothetical protein
VHHQTLKSSLIIASFLIGSTGCGTEPSGGSSPAPTPGAGAPSTGTPKAGTPSAGTATSKPSAAHAPTAQAQPEVWRGKVLETMDSGSYSYVHLDMGSNKIWVAGPQVAGLGVGHEVSMAPGMRMEKFHSPTLKREFDVIYFVGAIEGGALAPAPTRPGDTAKSTAGGAQAPVDPHAGIGRAGTPDKISGIAKVDGGQTVEEILTKAKEFSGKPVKVRGKVVKSSATMIMGAYWVHIQDGSGTGGTADLALTTMSKVKVGDTVVVEGSLTVDKDFGAGYRYAAIIERATITVEQ